jgi:polyisoprenoid-binding protein YceI
LVKGTLGHIEGSVEFDDESKTGVADIMFDMRAVETGRDFINSFVKSRHIFDAANYPLMRFQAQYFEFRAGQLIAVVGDLNLHGVTKPISMDVKRFACGDIGAAEKVRHQCSGNFQTTIFRSHFGMNSFSSMVNDEVRISVVLTLERQALAQQSDKVNPR